MSVRERAEQVTEWASNLHAAGFGEYLSESAWVARQLLEALNRIEQLETIHAETVLESARAEAVGQSKRVQAAKRLHHPSALEQHVCGECAHLWPCPTWLALNPKEADDA